MPFNVLSHISRPTDFMADSSTEHPYIDDLAALSIFLFMLLLRLSYALTSGTLPISVSSFSYIPTEAAKCSLCYL